MAQEAALDLVDSVLGVMGFLAFTLFFRIAFTATIWRKLDKRERSRR